MAFARAGIDVYTVPAEQTRILRALPYYMAREVAALWAYYFRPMKLEAAFSPPSQSSGVTPVFTQP